MPWPKGRPQSSATLSKRAATLRERGIRHAKPVEVNGQPHWRCSACSAVLPPDEFYADRSRPNGLKTQCKHCHNATSMRTRDPMRARTSRREHMRLAVARDPARYRARWKAASRQRPPDEKSSARHALASAVRAGRVTRPDRCSSCAAYGPVHGHHEDYAKPLDVKWLCRLCHAEAHFPLPAQKSKVTRG